MSGYQCQEIPPVTFGFPTESHDPGLIDPGIRSILSGMDNPVRNSTGDTAAKINPALDTLVPPKQIQTGSEDTVSKPAAAQPVEEGRPATQPAFGQRSSDRTFLLISGAMFLVILTGQYLTTVLREPPSLPWQRGQTFHSFRVDVNTGTWIEWMQLPGIGPSLAHRIVADREARGPFHSIDDLQRVDGIGPTTLNRIRPWLKFSHEPASSVQTDPQD